MWLWFSLTWKIERRKSSKLRTNQPRVKSNTNSKLRASTELLAAFPQSRIQRSKNSIGKWLIYSRLNFFLGALSWRKPYSNTKPRLACASQTRYTHQQSPDSFAVSSLRASWTLRSSTCKHFFFWFTWEFFWTLTRRIHSNPSSIYQRLSLELWNLHQLFSLLNYTTESTQIWYPENVLIFSHNSFQCLLKHMITPNMAPSLFLKQAHVIILEALLSRKQKIINKTYNKMIIFY